PDSSGNMPDSSGNMPDSSGNMPDNREHVGLIREHAGLIREHPELIREQFRDLRGWGIIPRPQSLLDEESVVARSGSNLDIRHFRQGSFCPLRQHPLPPHVVLCGAKCWLGSEPPLVGSYEM